MDSMIKEMIACVLMCASLSVMTSSSLAADGERASHQYPWMNFGTVEFDMTVQRDGKDEKAFLRFVVFKNGESLIESGRPGIRKRALQLPGSVSAYEGLASEDQIGISPKNPFMFIDMALAPILGPLTSAFPSGMEAVPRSGQPFSVARDNAQFKGSAERISDNEVRFHIAMELGDGKIHQISLFDGSWRQPRPTPLTDDFPMTNWRVTHKHIPVTALTTLGQARRLSETSSP
jgi:hypothetical protein